MQHWLGTSIRSKNDVVNKIRESHLLTLGSNIDPEFQNLKTQWFKSLVQLHPGATRYSIAKKAGRRHHYDFDLKLKNSTGDILRDVKLELKFNVERITDLPQVLSLPAPEYAEFFWDRGYVHRYHTIDPEIREPPDRETYLKELKKTSSNVAFFATAKEREGYATAAKKLLVNESISEFLNEFRTKIDMMDRVRETQIGKVFLMWSVKNQKFTVESITEKDFEIGGDPIILNGNVLAVGPWRFLLRWRNHKGILNPAWQIKISEI